MSDIGDLIPLRKTFRVENELVDPATVTFQIRVGTTLLTYIYGTHPQLVRESLGVYLVEYTPTASGTYYYRWSCTGIGQDAEEGFFRVPKSNVIDDSLPPSNSGVVYDAILPFQGGHATDILSTDGVGAFWAERDSLFPDQTGNAGRVLGTNGTTRLWVPNTGGGGGGGETIAATYALGTSQADSTISLDTTRGGLKVLDSVTATAEAPLSIWGNDENSVYILCDRYGIYSSFPSGSGSIFPPALLISPGNHTVLTSGTPMPAFWFSGADWQWSVGAISAQRWMVINNPTYSFTSPSTITDATTVEIAGAPIAGTNATITSPVALRVASGLTSLDGSLVTPSVGTSAASLHAFPSGTGDLVSVDANQILANKSCTTPTLGPNLANKSYVDSVAQGLDIKESVRANAAANVASLSGATTIDGVSLVAGNRVLLRGQTTATQNGIWVVAAGPWARSADMTAGSLASGAFCFVEEGTTYADTGWVCANDAGSDVVGVNGLVFTQFSGPGTYTAGTGLTLIGTQFNLANTSVTPGSYGSQSSVGTFIANAQGQLTAASSALIQIAESQVTNLTTDLAAKANDSAVVHISGTETVTGAKTFSSLLSAASINVSGTTASNFITSGVVNGASAVGNVLDNTNALSTNGAKLVSFRSGGSEVGSIARANSQWQFSMGTSDISGQHYITSGSSPTVVTNLSGWSSPTNGTWSIVSGSTDESGRVRLVGGAGLTGINWFTADGNVFTVTLNRPYPNGFEVSLSPANNAAGTLNNQFNLNQGWSWYSTGLSTWVLHTSTSGSGLVDGTTYEWSYVIKGR